VSSSTQSVMTFSDTDSLDRQKVVKYQPPDDPNEFSNLDRFLLKTKIGDLWQADDISVFGVRVQLTDESTNKVETCVYVPTLSSLYLCWEDGFVEYHEPDPVFNRLPFHFKLSSLLPAAKTPTGRSYIAVLWTCQNKQDQTSFLCVRSLPDNSVVGLIPLGGLQRESFWTAPSHLLTFNSMQGELYDQICDQNMFLMADLKERGIGFLQEQSCDSFDFNQVQAACFG
jgi:hypothetical protein